MKLISTVVIVQQIMAHRWMLHHSFHTNKNNKKYIYKKIELRYTQKTTATTIVTDNEMKIKQ